MMTFLRNHILIPKDQSYYPYYFLIFLVPGIISMFPLTSSSDWLYLVLLITFLKVYREGFIEEHQGWLILLIQLIIAMIFVFSPYSNFANLFIYPGWQFSFWHIKPQRFKHYVITLYLAVTVSFSFSLWQARYDIARESWLWILISTVFIFLSPIMARHSYIEQRRILDLSMTNMRLENVIRQHERDRIARDLHDNLGQSFSTITLKAELAARLLHRDLALTLNEIQDIESMSRDNLKLVRQIVANLHEQTIPSVLLEATHNLRTKYIILETVNEPLVHDWPLAAHHVLAAIIKEATTNILRHSQASIAKIIFDDTIESYCLTIKDNGQGIQSQSSQSYGISGMTERVSQLGGQLTLYNDKGLTIICTLPKEAFIHDSTLSC